MYQNSPGDTARLFVIRQRNVITDDQHLDVIAKPTGFLCRKTKVKTVASVILNDQQATCVTGYRLNGCQYRIHAWRSKYVATDSCG